VPAGLDGLSITNFLDYATQRQELQRYLPDQDQWVQLDKHWICDVLYTLDTENVQGLIDQVQAERTQKLEAKRDLNVPIRPEFAEALNQTLTFSSKYQLLISPHCSSEGTGCPADEGLEQEETKAG
jgi:hypothetical protein